MRLFRYCLPAAVLLGSLALLPAVASANWTGTYSVAGGGGGYEQENNYNCSSSGPNFGQVWDSSNNYYNMWSDSQMPSFSLPGGSTLVGATLNGSVVEYNGYGGIPPAASYYVGFGAGEGTASNAGNNPGCSNIAAWGGDGTSVYLPGNTSQAVAFTIHAYHSVLAYVNGAVPSYLGRPVYMAAGSGADLESSGSMSLQIQYAFQPTNLTVTQVQSGNGTQVSVAWNPNGNGGDISYVLQREALNSGGVAQNWTTLYQGTATSFMTSDQGCGYGYVYRVEAAGQDAATAWTTSSEWDEYPCSVSVSVPAGVTNYVNISWPEVTASAAYYIVWCQSSSCAQQRFQVGPPGTTTTAQLTGIQPNTEYTIWACSVTNAWGCPVAAAWTYAAVPTLSANNNGSGLSYDQQPLTWTANGNPAGTVYDLQQGTYAQSGAWQGGTVVYSGTGTSFTANQSAGGSYSYNVWAINAGYGTGTAASNGVPTQVAGTPTLTSTGSTTATVSWPTVAYMSQTGVVCEEPAGSAWVTIGTATSGATSMPVTGLQPDTQYYCATYAVASSQGFQWWQGTNTAYTAANAPTAVGLSNITEASITATWSPNGDPAGTQYYAVLEPAPGGGAWLQESGWITGTSWTPTGLSPGTDYEVWVEAENGSGQTSAFTLVGQAHTIPAAPSNFTATTGGLGWSSTAGRDYVTLSWAPSTGAAGYDAWVWNGAAYEQFDVGTATSWDSRSALIYPPDASLYPNVSEGSKGTPIFSHNGGGLNLRDQPLDLYCTTGTYYCTTSPSQNYWFGVSAYDASGNSSTASPGYACGQAGECQTPTLPLQTDPNAPTITGWSLNGGGAYTYTSTVSFSLSAAEGTSGIAAYALSNDGSTWTTTGVGGCAVGQAAPCQTTLSASGNWTLLPGPGSKTVWARVESTAGVWSPPQATSVYVNVDQTTPTVDVTLNGGASSTSSTSVTVGVTVSDPVAQQNTALTWQTRYSTDGGQAWSAWQSEGSAVNWSTAWTIPGGASGERTVLAQVENNDNNLGQGGATIYYAAPGTGGGASLPAGAGSGAIACTWPVNGSNVPATCVTSNEVTVPLTPPAGATEMRISLDDATWGPWEATASSVAVDLGSSAGAKTVWLQYQDASGTVTSESPVYYVYDPAAPSVQASWAGNASATDSSGHATLNLQAADDVGTTGMTVTVTENGAQLYSGALQNSLPLTLTGSGYQMVQVTATDPAGNQTSAQLGIYVE